MRDVEMADPWRRPSAFPSDSEFSLSQTDEILLKTSSRRTSTDVVEVTADRREKPRVKLTESERKWIAWMIYTIGFMVSYVLSFVMRNINK